MKIYRTAKRREMQEHDGYIYHLSKREAKKAHKQNALEQNGDTIQEFDVAMNKWDILDFLNRHCNYPDNG